MMRRYSQFQRRRGRSEAGGGKCHVQGLVRPVSVVLLAPGIQRSLEGLKVLEQAMVVEELVLQGLVQPLDLPRGGR